MNKITGISLGLILLVIIGFAFYSNSKTTVDNYDVNSIIAASADNGQIGDHIKGSADAPVVIYEYADFQCEHCAALNPKINAALEALDGKLAIVYRSFLLSYHQNATAAASAAEAAGLQGYWKQYADLLFANQAEWAYAEGSTRTALFQSYFADATEGQGDMDKFTEDIASQDVSKKIKFDMSLARKVGVDAVPALYIDGQLIEWSISSSIVVNGHTITWEKATTVEALTDLFTKIVNAKLN